jgi:hypothetical protein
MPLPSDSATLFELLCMIRILKVLEGRPAIVRWLNADSGNRVDLSSVRYFYQKYFPREVILSTSEFPVQVRQAVDRHPASLPGRADGLIQLAKPRVGFNAILVEAKSGGQSFDAAIY